ncbi:MAG: glycosyltransferase family 2 protein [Candidatus Methanomethyliaceae archaeon]
MNMRISVAMCTCNGASFLPDQLMSVLAQTRLPDELIICDDCSEDDTLDIVQETLASVKFSTIVKKNSVRLGPTKNFEQAISLCTGDVIVLCDQDDVWVSDKLARLEQSFCMYPDAGYVFSDALIVDERLQGLGYTLWQAIGFRPQELKKFKKGQQLEVLLKHNVVTGATLAFRSELRAVVLPIPQEWVHDAWIAFVAACCGTKGIAMETPLIFYRQHVGQTIGGRKLKLRERIARARSVGKKEYLLEIQRYEQAREHLRTLGINNSWVEKLLDEKIEHLRARARVWDRPGIQALLAPIEELVRGRYWKFSHGWSSFAKDLLVAIGWAREKRFRRASAG